MGTNMNQFETESKAAFARLRDAQIEPSPFLKSRIVARLDDRSTAKTSKWREVVIWRWVAGLATAACAVVGWLHLSGAGHDTSVTTIQHVALQPYVIHLDLGGSKISGATVAEVELPDGVRFVSKAHPEVSAMRKMRLPIPDEIQGRSRLPFVVSADRPGDRQLKLRILNSKLEVIEERVVPVSFANGAAKVL